MKAKVWVYLAEKTKKNKKGGSVEPPLKID